MTAAAQQSPRWPDFLVIGAAKSGTTSLHHQLGAHPELFVPAVKEPSYFAVAEDLAPAAPATQSAGAPTLDRRHWVTESEEYLRLFADAPSRALKGEVSPMYMAVTQSADRIAASPLGDRVRIIAILRDPIERAYSAFLHLRRDSREPLAAFDSALEAEAERTAAGWGMLWRYLALSRYLAALEPYLRLFAGRCHVVVYERYRAAPHETLAELFDFLGVERDVVIEVERRFNVSGEPRFPALALALRADSTVKKAANAVLPRRISRCLTSSARQLAAQRPPLAESVRQALWPRFEGEVEELSRRLDIDLRRWWGPDKRVTS